MYLEYSYLLQAVQHCSLDSELQALAAFLPAELLVEPYTRPCVLLEEEA